MYPCERTLAVVLMLGTLVGCGRSGSMRAARLDAATSGGGETRADDAVPVLGGTQPDLGLSGAPDSPGDGSESDVGGALPDGSAGDVGNVRTDAGEPDRGILQPDGNAADLGLPLSDGSTADATVPRPDGRALDTGILDPDAGMNKDEIVVACAWAASCAGPGSPTSPSQCIAEFAKTASRQSDIRLDHLLTCAKTSSCSEFRACWGGDLFNLDPFVTGGVCKDSVISVTVFGVRNPLVFDCTAMGGTCARLATSADSAGCNTRPCDGADKAAPSCAGTIARGCGGWTEYTSLDCAGSGRICRIEGNYAVCAGQGAACDETEKVSCAGSVASYCSRGARATVDCAKDGFATRCAAGAAPNEPCVVAGTECDPLSYVGQCDGANLKMCVNGSFVPINCLDLGFAFCDLPSIGYARCWEKR